VPPPDLPPDVVPHSDSSDSMQPPSTVETSDPSGVQRSSLSGVYRVDYQVG
jgi:hypothetical protein